MNRTNPALSRALRNARKLVPTDQTRTTLGNRLPPGSSPSRPLRTSMTSEEIAILRAIVAVLGSPRDRLRRLEPDFEAREAIRNLIQSRKGKARVPHGGLDVLDQCSMLLQGMLGDRPQSTLDVRR